MLFSVISMPSISEDNTTTAYMHLIYKVIWSGRIFGRVYYLKSRSKTWEMYFWQARLLKSCPKYIIWFMNFNQLVFFFCLLYLFVFRQEWMNTSLKIFLKLRVMSGWPSSSQRNQSKERWCLCKTFEAPDPEWGKLGFLRPKNKSLFGSLLGIFLGLDSSFSA